MKHDLKPALSRAVLGSVLGAVLVLAACANQATKQGGITVPPPLPAQGVKDLHWGVEVADPYRFLEDVNNPQVQQWMRGQADATNAILGRMPERKTLLDRMKLIEDGAGGNVSSMAQTEGGRLFYMRRDPGENQFKLVWRDSAASAGPDTVVFDPQTASTPGQPRAIMDFSPSPDGKKLAYAVQLGGQEIGTLHVIDVATGRALIEPIDRIRYSGVNWLENGSGFFYARLAAGYELQPAEKRFEDRTAYFHDLLALDGKGSDRPVFSPSRNPELALPGYAWPSLFPLPGTPLALAWVGMGVDRNITLLATELQAATTGQAQWRSIVKPADQVTRISASQNFMYFMSAKGAPRYQILRAPLTNLSLTATEVAVAQGSGSLAQMAAAADALYFTRREGVNTWLYRLAHRSGAVPERVQLPVDGAVQISSSHPKREGVMLTLASWTGAAKPYAVTPRSVTRLSMAKDGAFDTPADIESREVVVKSHDGTLLPLSIVMKKGTRLDGSNPTIVYGYGAYGSTDDPFFNPRVYAWIERGGIWATAHVRGGGVMGNDWHEAGRKTTKPNTWKDGIAAAEWLVANGYTQSARMAIYGVSAGGIFVGGAIAERPDLFAAAVPSVGVMDTIRVETSANGPANVPEYGSVKVEAEFKGLLAMSSYHQLRDGVHYPAVMALHGVNDIRVDVWQSAKFVSRLAAATASDKPVLLRLEYDAGHGQGSTRAQVQERTTDLYSFLLWQFGMPGFQPLP